MVGTNCGRLVGEAVGGNVLVGVGVLVGVSLGVGEGPGVLVWAEVGSNVLVGGRGVSGWGGVAVGRMATAEGTSVGVDSKEAIT